MQNSKHKSGFDRSQVSHCKFRTKHIFMKVTFYTVENVTYECSEELSCFVPVEEVSNHNHSIAMFFVQLSFMICKKYSHSHTPQSNSCILMNYFCHSFYLCTNISTFLHKLSISQVILYISWQVFCITYFYTNSLFIFSFHVDLFQYSYHLLSQRGSNYEHQKYFIIIKQFEYFVH